jgi:hypothetical protein
MSGGRLTYANMVATLALFVALGGGAYATQAQKVGPGDIKPDAVRTKHIADGSLRLRDLIAWRTAANFGPATLDPGDCSSGNIGQPAGDVVRPTDLIVATTERTVTSSGVPLGTFAFPSDPTAMSHAICNFGSAQTSLSGGLGRAFGIRR